MRVRVFIVEYVKDSRLHRHHESLSGQLAFALGKQLAIRGFKPRVRHFDMAAEDVDKFLRRFSAAERRRKQLL